MPLFGRVGTVHAVAIDRRRPQIAHIAMPNLVGVFGQRNALDLLFAARVEQAELDFRGVRGEQREIDALAVPGHAERMRQTFAKPVGQNLGHEFLGAEAGRLFGHEWIAITNVWPQEPIRGEAIYVPALQWPGRGYGPPPRQGLKPGTYKEN